MNHPENHPSNEAVFVTLISGPDGTDNIALELPGGERVMMTPAQARGLATSLITAVNRAEVKASLRVSTNMWRRMDETEARLSSVAS